jgi:AraC family cel operon transcriptional repressor
MFMKTILGYFARKFFSSGDNLLCYGDLVKILYWRDIAGKAAFHAARGSFTRAKPLLYHGHDFAELFWIDAGQGIHRINGSSLPLRRGTMVFMRPADCHGIDSTGPEDLKLTNVALPRDTLDFLRSRYFPGPRWVFGPSEKYPAARQLEPSQLRQFNHWADELSQAPRERLHLDRFLLNVLAALVRDRTEAWPEDAPDWLVQACRLLQKPEHFSQGVEHFLRLCGRSREHVARTVRRCCGMTPTAYVNGIRMAYARRQLEMGNQEIIEIAFDCGIENLSHFYSLFRGCASMTPRAYRLAHRKSL